MTEPVTAARNARLAKLLQDVARPGSSQTVCENVGTGLLSAAQNLRAAGMSPPEIEHTLSDFKVVFRNHTVLDQRALEWLATFEGAGLNDSQRLALAHVRRHQRVDNRGYRALTGCDAATATRELADLARRRLIERTGGRRWAEWRLAAGLLDRTDFGPAAEPPSPSVRTDSGGQVQSQQPVASGCRDVEVAGSPKSHSSDESAPPEVVLTKRQEQVWDLLANGPASSASLARRLGVTRGAVLNLLRTLESNGLVRTTRPGRRSRNQLWERVE